MQQTPLISVITPVYNGEAFLSECIESVLAQTYTNWECVIVNNCSTDRTLEIASAYAAKDARIRTHTNDSFLDLIPNWNNALRTMSINSKYCKIVHADDRLFPECLQLMFDVAESNPSVGIVGAYRIEGDHIDLDDMTYPIQVFSGQEICRRRLLGGHDVFGSPTSLLLRADLVRGRKNFYNEKNFHADTEICFDLLQNVDFGFVHQVLTYTRRHDATETSGARILATHTFSHFFHILKFGPHFLDEEEYTRRFEVARKRYYRSLAHHILYLNKREFIWVVKEIWTYHKKALADQGQRISILRLLMSMFVILYNNGLKVLRI